MYIKLSLVALALSSSLMACTTPATVTRDATQPPTALTAESATVAPLASATDMPNAVDALPTDTPNAVDALPTAIPASQLYFTPSQTEGPYYPPNKPTDRDNDLTQVAGQAATATGDIINITGKLIGSDGLPIAGAVIEIWHTDNQRIYLHPNDSRVSQRDANFQSYGESTTAADGSYSFRTIKPGLYEGRPRHIHVKIRWQGEAILTTQFYFGDESLGGAFVSGADLDAVVLNLTPHEDGSRWATRDLVLNWVKP